MSNLLNPNKKIHPANQDQIRKRDHLYQNNSDFDISENNRSNTKGLEAEPPQDPLTASLAQSSDHSKHSIDPANHANTHSLKSTDPMKSQMNRNTFDTSGMMDSNPSPDPSFQSNKAYKDLPLSNEGTTNTLAHDYNKINLGAKEIPNDRSDLSKNPTFKLQGLNTIESNNQHGAKDTHPKNQSNLKDDLRIPPPKAFHSNDQRTETLGSMYPNNKESYKLYKNSNQPKHSTHRQGLADDDIFPSRNQLSSHQYPNNSDKNYDDSNLRNIELMDPSRNILTKDLDSDLSKSQKHQTSGNSVDAHFYGVGLGSDTKGNNLQDDLLNSTTFKPSLDHSSNANQHRGKANNSDLSRDFDQGGAKVAFIESTYNTSPPRPRESDTDYSTHYSSQYDDRSDYPDILKKQQEYPDDSPMRSDMAINLPTEHYQSEQTRQTTITKTTINFQNDGHNLGKPIEISKLSITSNQPTQSTQSTQSTRDNQLNEIQSGIPFTGNNVEDMTVPLVPMEGQESKNLYNQDPKYHLGKDEQFVHQHDASDNMILDKCKQSNENNLSYENHSATGYGANNSNKDPSSKSKLSNIQPTFTENPNQPINPPNCGTPRSNNATHSSQLRNQHINIH